MAEPFDPYHKWLGIGPEEQPPNHYRLLGIRLFESDPDVIAAAADQRMGHVRTFQTGKRSAASQRLLNEVAAARLRLLNPQKKMEYDKELRQRLAPEPVQPDRIGAAAPAAMGLSAEAMRSSVSDYVRARRRQGRRMPAFLGAAVAAACLILFVALVLVTQPPRDPPPERNAAQANRTATAMKGRRRERMHSEEPAGVPEGEAPPREVEGLLHEKVRPEPDSTPSVGPGPVDARVWADARRANDSEDQPVGPRRAAVKGEKTGGRAASLPVQTQTEGDQGVAKHERPPADGGAASDVGLPDLVDRVEPSVVLIKTDIGTATGFVADSKRLIVTNYHVIHGATRATVTFSNGVSAEVAGYVAADRGKDLALLRIKTEATLTPISVHPDLPRKGEAVAAFGAPRGFRDTVSQGVVSAIRSGAEVEEVIGPERYNQLGFARDVTWVQTTAPISRGNSGGPLVSMKGKVVGISSWQRVDSQNLNFAVSSLDIRKLLSEGSEECHELAALGPRRRPPNVERPPLAPAASFGRIELPCGAVLTEAIVDVPEDWQTKLFPRESPIYAAKYPNDEIRAVAMFDRGKLHGPSATVHESGQLGGLAFYYMGQSDGPLRLWDENGERLLYAEYTRGKQDGLVCLFRNDRPWWVQQWENGRLVGEYLVKFVAGAPTIIPDEKLGPEDAKEFAAAKKKLSKLQAAREDAEEQFKNELLTWYREEDRRIRRELQSKLGPLKRRAISERANARRAANAAAMEALRRAAVRRGSP